MSADESTFVFRTDRGGGWDFWALDLKTNHARPITISRETKVFPALSRDASTVAWNSEAAVYVADLHTGATRRLCSKCEPEPSDWTKTGNIIVTLPDRSAIAIMNPHDASIHEIIRPAATALADTAVSPDDQWIAFLSKPDCDQRTGRWKPDDCAYESTPVTGSRMDQSRGSRRRAKMVAG